MFDKWINKLVDKCASQLGEKVLSAIREEGQESFNRPLFRLYDEYVKFGIVGNNTLIQARVALHLDDPVVQHTLRTINIVPREPYLSIHDVVSMEELEKYKARLQTAENDLRIQKELNVNLTESIRSLSSSTKPTEDKTPNL